MAWRAGRAGARGQGDGPTIIGDGPRSWTPRSRGTIHDHGIAWRVRLLPGSCRTSQARPRAREAARERGPPADDLRIAGPTGEPAARERGPPGAIPRSSGTTHDPG